MTTQEIIESADEVNYREASVRLTAVDCEIENTKEILARYVFEHPLKTLDVQEHIKHLQGQIETLEWQKQRLLPVWSDLKSRVLGW
jgi:hypothetical protein